MFSLYDVSIPVFIRGLENLDRILEKGAKWCAEQGRRESDLTQGRLIEDMRPLTAQIQFASDTAKGVVTRLAGTAAPMADEEQTIADLRARVAKTIAVLKAARREDFDGKEETQVEFKTPNGSLFFTGSSYVLGFAIPNFYFHMTTAYALLRQAGVPVGKRDFLGPTEA